MTPRLSIIAASIRRIGQALAETVEAGDPYWDNVVLAMRMDAVGDSDPYWSNTVLAMHMDGTDGSTTFTDEKGKAITAVGNCSISTAESKFGGSSAYFDGTGDAITIPNSQAAPVLAFGSGDFTIEGWILPLTMPYSSGYLLGFGKASVFSTGIHVSLLNTGGLGIGLNSDGYTFATSGHSSLIGNGWRHFAVVRSGNTITAYIDGVSRGSTSFTGTLGATGEPYYIGSDSWYVDNCYKGYLDELRITSGVARYTTNFTPPATAFQTSPPFIDEKAHTVIANGNAVIQTTTKKFGTGSAYFDGSGDYLTIPADASLNLWSGDFTIEAWVYPLGSTFNYYLFGSGVNNAGTSGWYWLHLSNTGFNFTGYSVSTLTGSAAITGNTWHHIALSRFNGTLRIFIDGVVVGSVVDSSNLGIGTHFTIGAGNSSGSFGEHWKGYIDDFRITKGVARCTANFTPSTQPIPVTLPYDKWWDNVSLLMRMDAVGDSDPLWSNVTLAMHMEGTNGSTTFTDLKGKTVTPSGNAQISTTQSKFGGSSAYSDGANSYLAVTHSADLSMDSSDFTIEMWVYKVANGPLLSKSGKYNESYANYALVVGTSGNLILSVGSSSSTPYGTFHGSVTGASAIPSAQWTHVAAVKSGTQYSLYINGNLDAQATITGVPSDQRAGVLRIFQEEGAQTGYSGYIDDLRITKGVARYTANFTPPTSAFPSANQFIDEKGHTVTPNGNAVIQSTTKRFGTGAAYFDGSGDYLTLAPSSSFDFSSVDFTVECWINLTSVSAINVIAACRNSGTGDGWLLVVSASGALSLQGTSGSPSAVTSAVSAVTEGEWSHVAACKSGSTTYVFVNGALVASGVIGIGPSSSETLYIGRHHLGAGYDFNGYIDDLRITKGVARYTADFTPPTVAFPNQ